MTIAIDLQGYALKIIMVVVWIDLAGSCADFQSERHYQVFADTMATGRVLRLNDEIGQLQEVMMQVTDRSYTASRVAGITCTVYALQSHIRPLLSYKFSIA